YHYSLGGVTGYLATPSSGSLTLGFGGVSAAITFTKVLVATLSPGMATTEVGDSLILSVGIAGGVPPVLWTLQVSGSSANLSGETFTPAHLGHYTIYLNSTDHAGDQSDAQATVTVEPALATSLSPGTAVTEVGASVTFTPGSTGGVAPVTWTLAANGPGMSGDTFTPASEGTYTVYLNASDGVGTIAQSTATVTVVPALNALLSPPTTTTQVGGSIVFSVDVTGGVAPITWTLQANGSSANLSGDTFTPSAPGTYTVYLNATDALGITSQGTATVTVVPALVATLSPGTAETEVGVSVIFSVGLTGGVGPITWTLISDGADVQNSTFTPASPGTYTIFLNATDAVGSTSQATAIVTVEPALHASLSPETATTQVGGSITFSPSSTGGVGPVGWTLEANGPGMSGDTFTPTSEGTYTVYLNATDGIGSLSQATATVTVEPALSASLSPGLATTQVGGSVTFTPAYTGGVAPITWTLAASGPGLSGDTFTPTLVGTYTIYLDATDAVGSTSQSTATVIVVPALVASLSISPEIATTQVGGSVVFTVGIAGGVPPVNWTLEASGPSANLSGGMFTPTAPGEYTIYLNATDAVGSSSEVTARITVEPALVASLSPGIATTRVGRSVTFSPSYTGGVAPVTWMLAADGPGLTGAMFSPTHMGTYTIYLNATDAVGSTSQATATVTVESALYSVTFAESGLPHGKIWSVAFNGTLESTKVSTITFTEPDGSYTYLIRGSWHESVSSPTPAEGTLLVDGADVLEPVVLVRGLTVDLRFHETGLAEGTPWCVTLDSKFCTTTRSQLLPNFSPGIYTYAIGSFSGMTTLAFYNDQPVLVSGSLSVPPNRALLGTFLIRYSFPISFVESGLPVGSSWKVTAGGVSESATQTTIIVYLTNGTYPFRVHSEAGYTRSVSSGHVTVRGAPVSLLIRFVPRGLRPSAPAEDEMARLAEAVSFR
ncbi:MAG: hypothetical protein ACLQD8_08510, partial [Thermoplasmata archaeon]